MKRTLPPVYFLAILVAMVVAHFVFPIERYWGTPSSLIGLVPLVLGIGLNVLADRLFARHGTTVKPFEESAALVTAFPFSMTRNPMYLGITLMLLGVAMLLGTVTPLLLATVFPICMDVIFIREEESMLASRFGPEWERYRSQVRRWL